MPVSVRRASDSSGQAMRSLPVVPGHDRRDLNQPILALQTG
jgi:hypothetical protein